MAYTDINSEDRLVQETFAEHLQHQLGWDRVSRLEQESLRFRRHPGAGERARGGVGAGSAGRACPAQPKPAGLRAG